VLDGAKAQLALASRGLERGTMMDALDADDILF
jgi:uncharacterized protein with GYD domain